MEKALKNNFFDYSMKVCVITFTVYNVNEKYFIFVELIIE